MIVCPKDMNTLRTNIMKSKVNMLNYKSIQNNVYDNKKKFIKNVYHEKSYNSFDVKSFILQNNVCYSRIGYNSFFSLFLRSYFVQIKVIKRRNCIHINLKFNYVKFFLTFLIFQIIMIHHEEILIHFMNLLLNMLVVKIDK